MTEPDELVNRSWVANVPKAIEEDRIKLAIQGIHSVQNHDQIMYGESLARLIDSFGTMHLAGEFVPALDASGKCSILDHHVIEMVLDELDDDPLAVLACNISSETLSNADQWQIVIDSIVSRRHLASRLILEITETRPLDCVVAANKSIQDVRNLGCRVAMNGFGGRHLSPIQLLDVNVDILKIDGSFAQRLRTPDRGGNSLEHIVGFAASIAPTVVVEGIETAEQLAAVKSAGASHIQGYFLSRPVNRFELEDTLPAN